MKAPVSLRTWFAMMAAILWAGIYFTGFSAVSWLLYLPATGLTVASLTGICLSQFAVSKLFGTKQKEKSSN